MGWSERGVPTLALLQKLGLERFAPADAAGGGGRRRADSRPRRSRPPRPRPDSVAMPSETMTAGAGARRNEGEVRPVQTIVIDGSSLTLADVRAVAHEGAGVAVAPTVRGPIDAARAYVEQLIADGRVVYGITTGFGKFSDVTIAGDDVVELQRNLVLSHCCGVGEPIGAEAHPGADAAAGQRAGQGLLGGPLPRPRDPGRDARSRPAAGDPQPGVGGGVGRPGPARPPGFGDDRRGRGGLAGAAAAGPRGDGGAGIDPLVLQAKEGPGADQRHPVHDRHRRAGLGQGRDDRQVRRHRRRP